MSGTTLSRPYPPATPFDFYPPVVKGPGPQSPGKGLPHRMLFFSGWLLINLIQAYATELFDDEAYYWVYAQRPDWGYFDHPPMIALLIRAGYALFPNELGVRLLSVCIATAALVLTEHLTTRKDAPLFYAICLSLALAQIGGFLAVPDTPLMGFVALYFFLYRRFLQSPSPAVTVLLALSIAGMLYTKYHGVLVVLFTLVSNPRLLKQKQAWMVAGIVTFLFLPHLVWQYRNAYPSLTFHLFERNAPHYHLGLTLEYLGGQILIAGPLVGWLLIYAAFRHRPQDVFQRALWISGVGIYAFFLISTLKGKSEANWTVPVFIGLIVLAHQYLIAHPRWRPVLFRGAALTFLLVLTARILMIADLPPSWWMLKDEFHGNRKWVESVRQRAGGLPVVFLDTYQNPSKYMFYGGGTAYSLNTVNYRRNNFNFWPYEDSLFGKPAYLVGKAPDAWFRDTLGIDRLGTSAGRQTARFYAFSRLMVDQIETLAGPEGQTRLRFRTRTPPHYLPYLQLSPYDTCALYLTGYRDKKVVGHQALNIRVGGIREASQWHEVLLSVNLPAGAERYRISISNCIPGQPTMNSTAFDID